MPVASYECLFLLDPTKTATDADGVKAQLHTTLEKYGAQILASRKWDDRKLAYPIKGHKKGVYHLTYFKADTLKMIEVERDFRLNENILRHCLSRIDAKWDEDMLAVAKDEQRLALQIMHDEAPEGGALGAPVALGEDGLPILVEGGDDRPRRGRRNPEAEVGKE